MKESLKNLGGKAIAVVVLIFAALILLKVVLGVIKGFVWMVLIFGAVLAIIWALNRIL